MYEIVRGLWSGWRSSAACGHPVAGLPVSQPHAGEVTACRCPHRRRPPMGRRPTARLSRAPGCHRGPPGRPVAHLARRHAPHHGDVDVVFHVLLLAPRGWCSVTTPCSSSPGLLAAEPRRTDDRPPDPGGPAVRRRVPAAAPVAGPGAGHLIGLDLVVLLVTLAPFATGFLAYTKSSTTGRAAGPHHIGRGDAVAHPVHAARACVFFWLYRFGLGGVQLRAGTQDLVGRCEAQRRTRWSRSRERPRTARS